MFGPPGVRPAAQREDRLKKLENRLEELANMLDMVKAQVNGYAYETFHET